MPLTLTDADYKAFLNELKHAIEEKRYKAARAVNKELILLYHHIGTEILKRQEIHGWGLESLMN